MSIQDLLHIAALTLVTSLIIWGAHSVICPGRLFECIDRAYHWFTSKLMRWPLVMRFFYQLALPLFRCPICMSSVWSIAAWCTFAGPLHWHVLILMLMVCGLNTLVVLFTDYDYADEQQPDPAD